MPLTLFSLCAKSVAQRHGSGSPLPKPENQGEDRHLDRQYAWPSLANRCQLALAGAWAAGGAGAEEGPR